MFDPFGSLWNLFHILSDSSRFGPAPSVILALGVLAALLLIVTILWLVATGVKNQLQRPTGAHPDTELSPQSSLAPARLNTMASPGWMSRLRIKQ